MKPTHLPHYQLTEIIIGCFFEVMNELGAGFNELVYKNSLFIALRQKGLRVETEQKFDVNFRGHIVGSYRADIIVENTVIIELKCVGSLCGDHEAQLINYLNVSDLPVGLLANFGNSSITFKTLYNKKIYDSIIRT